MRQENLENGGQSRPANRLIHEKSPYLLQHAHNPVDWYAWGEEAFEKAEREHKPVFLSIGYSSCHWCHVMEKESFENGDVAELMNSAFVSIKVDREERPDIDESYMYVCQTITGSGGWPLSIIMTPDKKPFFAATYIPRETRGELVGMLDLIPQIDKLWKTQSRAIMASSERFTESIRRTGETGNDRQTDLNEEVVHEAFRQIRDQFDPRYGGFGRAPKFPGAQTMLFLLRYWYKSDTIEALDMVTRTLREMRRGGVYDQIGFGFHRYSTDDSWLVPHFEKMLYDQATMLLTCTQAFQATKNALFGRTASETAHYIIRELHDRDGGFFSSQDADSEGQEGAFYLWTDREIRDVLGSEDAALAQQYFGIGPQGNYEDSTQPGKNILHIAADDQELAARLAVPENMLPGRIESIRRKLFAHRERREKPALDDKILTDWNGMTIAAMAQAGRVLGNDQFTQAAQKAFQFIVAKMQRPDGGLMHRYRDGEAAIAGFADDYAAVIWGCIELYETTFDTRYLRAAMEFERYLSEHFLDGDTGGFFRTADYAEKVILNRKAALDSPQLSANALAADVEFRLAELTGKDTYQKRAHQLMKAFSRDIAASPSVYTAILATIGFWKADASRVVISGLTKAPDTADLIREFRKHFLPDTVILFRPAEIEEPDIVSIVESTATQIALSGRATAYVCKNRTCYPPVTDSRKMMELLGRSQIAG